MSPSGLAMTCRFIPCLLVLAGVERPVRGDPVDRDQRPVQDHVGVPGLLRVPDRLAQLRRPGGEQCHGLVHVPPGRRGPDPEPGRELGERLALAQVGQDQQGLLRRGSASASSDPIAARWRRMIPAAKFRVLETTAARHGRKALEPLVLGVRFWSTASFTRGFAMPRGDTPHRHQTVTNPSTTRMKLAHGPPRPARTIPRPVGCTLPAAIAASEPLRVERLSAYGTNWLRERRQRREAARLRGRHR